MWSDPTSIQLYTAPITFHSDDDGSDSSTSLTILKSHTVNFQMGKHGAGENTQKAHTHLQKCDEWV